MGHGLPAAHDHEPQPPNRGSQHRGLRHHDRRGPPLTRPHHAYLRHRVILRERSLDGRRRQLDAVGKHDHLTKAPPDPQMTVRIDLGEVARFEPVAGFSGTRP